MRNDGDSSAIDAAEGAAERRGWTIRILIPIGAAALAAAFAEAPALALGPVIVPCANTDITPNAVACAGFYQGNLIAGTASARADQQAALDLIGYDGPPITAAFFGAAPKDDTGDGLADFGVPMIGQTWIAIHFGAGLDGPVAGFPGGGTAFYRLNLPGVTNVIDLNWGAGSTAIL